MTLTVDRRSPCPTRHIGELIESSKALRIELSGWRLEPISTTRLAGLIPPLVVGAWVGVLRRDL